jgi:hypothetical protein
MPLKLERILIHHGHGQGHEPLEQGMNPLKIVEYHRIPLDDEVLYVQSVDHHARRFS